MCPLFTVPILVVYQLRHSTAPLPHDEAGEPSRRYLSLVQKHTTLVFGRTSTQTQIVTMTTALKPRMAGSTLGSPYGLVICVIVCLSVSGNRVII